MRSERLKLERMKDDTRRYFEIQLSGLKDYKTEYPQIASLIRMKEDKIKGAADLAAVVGLLSFDEFLAMRREYGV